jgi:hypothetical protein
LATRGWRLSAEATPETLLRRVTLDLTGLPPTPEEIDAFLADRSPGAYERVVDRLLASPRYGEHFARTWLDAVRYADTHGLHLDNVRTIWPYRDWVVRAFNRNQRFDDFTIDQLAGDLRPQPTLEQLIGSGYNRNHLTTSEGGAIEAEAEARNTGDRTDTTAAIWMGSDRQLRVLPRPQVRSDFDPRVPFARRLFQRPRRPPVGRQRAPPRTGGVVRHGGRARTHRYDRSRTTRVARRGGS